MKSPFHLEFNRSTNLLPYFFLCKTHTGLQSWPLARTSQITLSAFGCTVLGCLPLGAGAGVFLGRVTRGTFGGLSGTRRGWEPGTKRHLVSDYGRFVLSAWATFLMMSFDVSVPGNIHAADLRAPFAFSSGQLLREPHEILV